MNKNLFPLIVGTAKIRNAEYDGEFLELECSTAVSTKINTTETKQLVCGKGETLTLEKPGVEISLKVIKTKNPDLIGKIFSLNVLSNSANRTITNEANTFDENGKIVLLHYSNDNNGVGTLVLKSSDGLTTYALNTDYTVTKVNNITTITRVTGGTIPANATVLISGVYVANPNKEVSISRTQRAKPRFTIECYGADEATGTKFTRIQAKPVTLSSEYLLEMLDAFRDGDINGSTLTFTLDDNGKCTLKDDNI